MDRTTYRTRDLPNREFRSIQDQIARGCRVGESGGKINVSTPDAYLNIPLDATISPVGSQLGGYNGTWTKKGRIAEVTITNDAGANSFFYHGPPNVPGKARAVTACTINQTFVVNTPCSQ